MARQNFHKKIRKYELKHTDKVLILIIGLIGFIFFWRGLWQVMGNMPLLNNPAFLVIIGFILMYTSGLLIKIGKK